MTQKDEIEFELHDPLLLLFVFIFAESVIGTFSLHDINAVIVYLDRRYLV